MNCSTFIKLLIWLTTLLLIVEFGFSLINASNTFLNIIGAVMFPIFAIISYKTNCFTLIKFKKDEEANN